MRRSRGFERGGARLSLALALALLVGCSNNSSESGSTESPAPARSEMTTAGAPADSSPADSGPADAAAGREIAEAVISVVDDPDQRVFADGRGALRAAQRSDPSRAGQCTASLKDLAAIGDRAAWETSVVALADPEASRLWLTWVATVTAGLKACIAGDRATATEAFDVSTGLEQDFDSRVATLRKEA